MAINYFWKVWLRLNHLIKDIDNYYKAEVSAAGSTKRNEDIASKIIEEGSEIKYDTLLNILNQRDRIVCHMLQEGNRVMTGCSHISPRVSGSWPETNIKFNPEVHKITVDMVPGTGLRKALEEVGVEVLGVKDSDAYIGLVTDTATGATNGTITPGDDILIEGNRLKITPENEAGLGVVFTGNNGSNTFVSRRLTQNNPKKILARVPDLASGEYTLKVITRFSKSSTLLNEPRVIEYGKKLVVS